ncbi:hypothetical protein E0H75_29640 [Kribbella capetownensis]|uniref:Enoyl reductase n=1 Tax=Kribbella capetownensis TaxID=1572659 RepID=A0A4R0JI21_9ACTN|nr:hypothetical protein [Kribbella capetownensis]TCC45877.1 hypothetical protein E0H75_29640 [Kribbella capetownensis]
MLRLRTLIAIAGCGAGFALAAPVTAFAYGHTPTTTHTEGGTITVTVTGTGVKGGSAGHAASRTVSVPSPCYMSPGMTGKEYYEWVSSGKANADWHHTGGDLDGPFTPYPGYEQHKDDDKGHWYGGSCSSETFGDDLDSFFEYADKWFAAHKSVYVPAGQAPPAPPVPPELLRDVAADEMTIPEPVLDWNPKRAGDASTLVNMDTWVWLKDQQKDLYVEATANSAAGALTARVDAALSSLTVSAPSAGSTTCNGPGTPYAPGASNPCTIQFTKASPLGGTTPVTATTTWHATWSYQGTNMGAIPQQPAPQSNTTNIGVLEVQAVAR